MSAMSNAHVPGEGWMFDCKSLSNNITADWLASKSWDFVTSDDFSNMRSRYSTA